MNIRTLIGWGALLALALGLNLLIWRQDLAGIAAVPLAIALLLGALWLGMVVVATLRHARGQGRTVGGINAVLASLVFLGILIVVYAFFQRWDAAWDLTQEGRRDLAPQTRQVLETLNQDVEVYCFFLNIDDPLVLIARDKTRRFLEQCGKYTSRITVEELDPQIDRPRLETLQITHASPQGTIVIKCGERRRVITLTGGSPRLEERDFTNALINVLRRAEPKVYFLSGHNERDIADENESSGGSMFNNLLVGESYKTEKIQLKISDTELPQDCDILVINNPQGDLHPQEKKIIQGYLERGGRLLLMLDPWLSVDPGAMGGEVIRPWMEESYGIKIGSDIVVSDQQTKMWVCELTGNDQPFEGIDAGFGEFRGAFSVGHPITRTFDQVMVFQANRTVSLAETPLEGVAAMPLLRTTPDYWAESDVARLRETGKAVRNSEETQGPLPLAVAATVRTTYDPEHTGKPREARIVVLGDSDFASNGQLIVPGNLNFLLNAVAWLGEQQELIAIRPSGKSDPPLILSDTQQRAVAWLATLLPAQAVALIGLAVFIARRKNR